MGSCSSKSKNKGLSIELREKARGIFKQIDVNKSGSIDKNETLKFWKANFAKLNTEALFNAVDFDKSGEITEDEWLAFWELVKKSGHTEKEINEELENLTEGKAWVQFQKVDQFVKRDQVKKKSDVKNLVSNEKKRLSAQLSDVEQQKTSNKNQPQKTNLLLPPEQQE